MEVVPRETASVQVRIPPNPSNHHGISSGKTREPVIRGVSRIIIHMHLYIDNLTSLFFCFFFSSHYIRPKSRKELVETPLYRLAARRLAAAKKRKPRRKREKERSIGRAVNVSATDDARRGRGARADLGVRRTRAGRRIPTRRVMRTYQHRSACYLLSNGYHRSSHGRSVQRAPSKAPNLSCAHRRAAPHRS